VAAKDNFIAHADAICSTYNDLALKATKNLRHPGARQAIATIQHRLVPLYERRDAELAQLEPPGADRAAVAQIVADLKAVTDDIALDPAAYVADHGATAPARKAAAEAAAYGFAVCGGL
jgi:hypothetical protein